MSYTINLTDGSIFATVADGTINTDSSVVLPGRNYTGYGELIAENFIRTLENSASVFAPANPLTGQIWFDANAEVLRVYDGTSFKNLGASSQASPPPTSIPGDLWFDTTTLQLNVYDGTQFVAVGPGYTSTTGLSGAIVEIVADNFAVDHVVTKLYVANSLVGIISKDAVFTPGVAIGGFTTISPGIQLATTVGSETPLFVGTATDSELLGGLASTDFLSAVGNNTTSGSLGILNDNGLTVGIDSDIRLKMIATDAILANITNNGDLLFQINALGNPNLTVITLNSGTGRAEVSTPLTDPDITNKLYVDTGLALKEDVGATIAATLISVTATGGVSAGTAQTAIAELDTEKYDKTGGLISGNVSLSSEKIGFTVNENAKIWANAAEDTGIRFDISTTVRDIELLSDGVVGIAVRGNSTTGPTQIDIGAELDMNTNKIINLVDPTLAQDAATRQFVLDQVAAGNGISDVSLATNGYIHFTNGLVVLWGKTALNAGQTLTLQPLPITLDIGYTFTVGWHARWLGWYIHIIEPVHYIQFDGLSSRLVVGWLRTENCSLIKER